MEQLLSINIVREPPLYAFDAASLLAVLYLLIRSVLLPRRLRFSTAPALDAPTFGRRHYRPVERRP
ncbi:MAG: hypothetical protein M3017_17020 [Actinomycetota bacterium]|nr:hypothetical protein [Actinomycetota bacterium]